MPHKNQKTSLSREIEQFDSNGSIWLIDVDGNRRLLALRIYIDGQAYNISHNDIKTIRKKDKTIVPPNNGEKGATISARVIQGTPRTIGEREHMLYESMNLNLMQGYQKLKEWKALNSESESEVNEYNANFGRAFSSIEITKDNNSPLGSQGSKKSQTYVVDSAHGATTHQVSVPSTNVSSQDSHTATITAMVDNHKLDIIIAQNDEILRQNQRTLENQQAIIQKLDAVLSRWENRTLEIPESVKSKLRPYRDDRHRGYLKEIREILENDAEFIVWRDSNNAYKSKPINKIDDKTIKKWIEQS